MAAMYSANETGIGLSTADETALLQVAADALRYGLEHAKPLAVDPLQFAPNLRDIRATFVTLTIDKHLRGCIGALEARRPTVVDVAHNAYTAGFADPRFGPLARTEAERIHIQVSLLSTPQSLQFTSQQDLLAQLRPGLDGLILREGLRRGTFLPAVWETLPEADEFLRQLKLKAGLPPDYWSSSLHVDRYTTHCFAAPLRELSRSHPPV